jgi:hypothetical protein
MAQVAVVTNHVDLEIASFLHHDNEGLLAC